MGIIRAGVYLDKSTLEKREKMLLERIIITKRPIYLKYTKITNNMALTALFYKT